MQFIVHIGVNKTGTSSLQRAFFEHRDAVSEQGVLYPVTGIQSSAHHNLSRAINGAAPASLGMSETWEEDLRAEFGDHDLCILSSEHFATLRDPAPLARICPPGQTRIVVYLRDYARYMVSWYQQAVHSRPISMSLDDFLDSHRVSFAEIIARWAAVFGRENVIVRQYERDKLKDRDIVADFCDLVRPGLEATLAGVLSDSNPSLSGNLLFFKRMLNAFISREESLEIASEMGALTALDPSFRGKLATGPDTLRRIRFLTRKDGADVMADTGFNMTSGLSEIKGSPSPDLTRLESDIDMIVTEAKSRNFKMMEYVARMGPLSALRAVADTPAVEGDEAGAVRDLAQTLFSLKNKASDEGAPQEEWDEVRAHYVAEARQILRQLSARGCTVSKQSQS